MSNVQNVNNSYSKYTNDVYKTGSSKDKAENEKAKDAANETSTDIKDEYVPSKSYKVDAKKVSAMKADLQQKSDAFEKMISVLFQKQGITYNKAAGIKKNLENLISGGGVSEAERLEAQKAISEDGEWGVEKTAARILDFAKAVSGGDPSKIETMKNAFIKGYKEAEKAWGGELPEISKKTYDKVMEGFDKWASEG